jgi:hypothetical protein
MTFTRTLPAGVAAATLLTVTACSSGDNPAEDAEWPQPLVDRADQIGRKAEAEQSIADYNATIDRLSPTVRIEGMTVAVVSLQDDQFVLEDEDQPIEVPTDPGFTLLTDSGNREADGSFQFYSRENLNILQVADVIFVQNPDNVLSDDVLWKRLPAVVAGRTPQLLYNHRAGFPKVGANFAEYVAEQRADNRREKRIMDGRHLRTVKAGVREEFEADLPGTEPSVVRHLPDCEMQQQFPQGRRDRHGADRRADHPGDLRGACCP